MDTSPEGVGYEVEVRDEHHVDGEDSLFLTGSEPDDVNQVDIQDDQDELEFYGGGEDTNTGEDEDVSNMKDEYETQSTGNDDESDVGTESMGEMTLQDQEDIIEEESKLNKYSQWKIDHEKMLAEKRLKAQEDRVIRLNEMKTQFAEFLRNREEQIAKTKRANEEAELLFVEERDDEVEGKEWMRTFSLLGLGTAEAARTGSNDVSRMKSVLIKLKGEVAGSR